jgi:putative transposase
VDQPRPLRTANLAQGRAHEGFYVRDLRVRRLNRRWGEVQVPKAGWVRFRISRGFCDIERASSARVTLDRAGRWHVSFTTAPRSLQRSASGSMAGLDMGIAASVTTSDAEHLRMPVLFSPREEQRKRRLQRKLARQQRGSARRCRTKTSLAKLSAREADRRKDWIEKVTTQLVLDHDVIVLEDLKVKNMVRSAKGNAECPGTRVRQKAGLNRSITNQAWATFAGASPTRRPTPPRPSRLSSSTPLSPPSVVRSAGTCRPRTARAKRSSAAVPVATPPTRT